jgi:hypothetical protein
MNRRPKLPHLARLYDEGAEAAATGAECPYKGDGHGNLTRRHIWRQGNEDTIREADDLESDIAALI